MPEHYFIHNGGNRTGRSTCRSCWSRSAPASCAATRRCWTATMTSARPIPGRSCARCWRARGSRIMRRAPFFCGHALPQGPSHRLGVHVPEPGAVRAGRAAGGGGVRAGRAGGGENAAAAGRGRRRRDSRHFPAAADDGDLRAYHGKHVGGDFLYKHLAACLPAAVALRLSRC